ncbi:MAG: hypothetical protein IKL68_04840, partial [Clostridia bacterium]|nr:hypothetical protein [Clostridia bacterium]
LQNKGLIESGVTTNSDGSKTVTTKTGFVANVMQDGESNLIISLGTSNATIAINPTSLSGDITDGIVTKTITVTASNVIGDITWTTSNANVATVTGDNAKATVTMKNNGTATITATYGSAKASCSVTVTGTVTSLPGLGSLITAANYGDTVDYTVTVNGTTYSNWQIYYHNSEYVYLIAENSIGNVSLDKGTTVASLTSDELALYEKFRVGTAPKYTLVDTVNGGTSYNSQAVAQLIKDYANFANKTTYGTNVVGAIGGPTIELLAAGWDAKEYTPTLLPLTISEYGYEMDGYPDALVTSDGLYVPSGYYYWLASPSAYSEFYGYVMLAGSGRVDNMEHSSAYGVRPVICLKASIPATVGTGDYDFNLVK